MLHFPRVILIYRKNLGKAGARRSVRLRCHRRIYTYVSEDITIKQAPVKFLILRVESEREGISARIGPLIAFSFDVENAIYSGRRE